MRPLLTLACTLLLLSSTADAQSQPASPAALPHVTATALDRSKVKLPADFTAPFNLLILSFQRNQQSAVDGWATVLASMPQVQTWLLPVAPRANGLYRWWLNASLRSSLPSTEPRRFTVPLYVNEGEFLRSLQIHSEEEVAVLLTDRTGRVLWRTAGPVTESKRATLVRFVLGTGLH